MKLAKPSITLLLPQKLRRKVAVIISVLLWLAVPLNTYSEGTPQSYKAALFTNVGSIPDNQRVDRARDVYKANCRKMSEADAMRSLDDLNRIAKKLNDLRLQCAVFDMRADYYSVNGGYNPTSTKLHEQAIRFADEHNLTLESAIYMHRKAVYYYIYKQNIGACRYFLFAQDLFRQIGFNKVPDIGTYLAQTGDFYYAIGDNENARPNLIEALKYQAGPSRQRLATLTSIGLTYRNVKQYPKALEYFNQSLAMAKDLHDTVWIGITTGNIGSIFFLQKDYDKALPLIRIDFEVSSKYKQVTNAAIAALRLAKINLDRSVLRLAQKRLATADSLLNLSAGDVLKHRVVYLELKAQLAEQLGLAQQADQYRKTFDEYKDSLANRDNIDAIERVRLQWEVERSQSQINKVKQNARQATFERNMVILVLTLLVVIGILLINRMRLRSRQKQELLEAEKRRLDDELKNAKMALNGYTENLLQKNQLIDEIRTEMEHLQLKFNDQDGARQLEKMMEVHIMTEENWEEFKKLFNKVYPTFLFNLRNRFPHLTATDTRLMALIRLNLNNREMAGMLGITTDGVKKAKQRLRKKLEIEGDAEIENVIADL